MTAILLAAAFAVRIGQIAPDVPPRAPQLAANGSMVGLTFGAGKEIYFSLSQDSGKTFSAPVRVSGGEIIPFNRHRGPHIAFSGRTIVITAIVGKKEAEGTHAHGLPSDGDLLVWRSADGLGDCPSGRPATQERQT